MLPSYLTIFKSYTVTSHATVVNYVHRNARSYLKVLHANVASCITKNAVVLRRYIHSTFSTLIMSIGIRGVAEK